MTIRRLIKKPSSKPYTRFEEGSWEIDTNYLFSVYSAIQPQSQPTQTTYSTIIPELKESKDEVIQLLKNEVTFLKNDLVKKDELINNLVISNQDQVKLLSQLSETIKLFPNTKVLEAEQKTPKSKPSNRLERFAAGLLIVVLTLFLVLILLTALKLNI